MAIDYSLYLVADTATAQLKHRDLAEVVQAAIEGGMVVLLLLYMPSKLKSCRRYHCPISR